MPSSPDTVTPAQESQAATSDLTELITVLEQQHDETLTYLDAVNSGIVFCVVLLALIFGALVVRFFYERVRT